MEPSHSPTADMKMPQLVAPTCEEHPRQKRPQLAFVLVTGCPDRELSGRALSSGVCALLAKPFTPDELELALMAAAQGACLLGHAIIERQVSSTPVSRRKKLI